MFLVGRSELLRFTVSHLKCFLVQSDLTYLRTSTLNAIVDKVRELDK